MKEKTWVLRSHEKIKTHIPISTAWQEIVQNSTYRLKSIFSWKSNRKALIIWPCSADFEESLYEYAEFIASLREQYSDKIEFIMRFYTGKPRTVWGWKGLQNSNPWEEPDMIEGIKNSRRIAINIIEKYWLPLADEMLHSSLADYFNDIYSYLAVWARSTENQSHREVWSGLEMPVGYKNPTSWDIKTMTNSIRAAQTPSTYHILKQVYNSSGNSFAHGILRGWNIPNFDMLSNEEKEAIQNIYGANEKWVFPNYSLKYIQQAFNLTQKGVKNPWIIIDGNHDNSWKVPEKQIEIIKSVFESIKGNKELENFVKWFMVESYLYDGRQEYDPNESLIIKWKSLTDPCIGKKWTKKLIKEIYKNI
jgi:3-deoxy-7-phosphoheptulonate synthase